MATGKPVILKDGTIAEAGLSMPHIIKKVASGNGRNAYNDEKTSISATYELVKTINLTNGLLGQQRFMFRLGNNDGATTVYGRIKKNGAWLGAEQSTTNDVGGIITILNGNPTNGGSAYLVNDVLTITTGGLGGTVRVATLQGVQAGLHTVVINAGGTDYPDGAVVIAVAGGGAGGTLNCTASGGAIVSVDSVATAGTGYAVANGVGTAGGGGNDDATVDVQVLEGPVASVVLVAAGVRYTNGAGKMTVGGNGTGCTLDITAVSPDNYSVKSEDITQDWNPNDTCELWIHSDGAKIAYTDNFSICYDDSATVEVASTNI